MRKYNWATLINRIVQKNDGHAFWDKAPNWHVLCCMIKKDVQGILFFTITKVDTMLASQKKVGQDNFSPPRNMLQKY